MAVVGECVGVLFDGLGLPQAFGKGGPEFPAIIDLIGRVPAGSGVQKARGSG
jgi:hypothetical protein